MFLIEVRCTGLSRRCFKYIGRLLTCCFMWLIKDHAVFATSSFEKTSLMAMKSRKSRALHTDTSVGRQDSALPAQSAIKHDWYMSVHRR